MSQPIAARAGTVPGGWGFKDSAHNFLFILPALLIFGVFTVYPFIDIILLSLHEWDGISPDRIFVGFDNFMELARDPVWWQSMGNAGYITLIALTFQNALAFALALACDREMRLKSFYRVVFFIPPVLSEIVVGLVWSWILYYGTQSVSGMAEPQQIGLLNYFLDKIGMHHLVNNWLSNPKTALTCIAVVHSWKGFGFAFILFLAGLQTIDHQLYEAARVDGAGSVRTFFHVTLPMMVPVIMMVVILTIIGAMQGFILILAMVSEGLEYFTEVPVTRILNAMTSTQEYGKACAMGVTFGVLLVIVSFTVKKLSERIRPF